MNQFNVKSNASIVVSENFKEGIQLGVKLTANEVDSYSTTYSPKFLGMVITFNHKRKEIECFTWYNRFEKLTDLLENISSQEKFSSNELVTTIDPKNFPSHSPYGYRQDDVVEKDKLITDNIFKDIYIELLQQLA
jgi:hypothetical protein